MLLLYNILFLECLAIVHLYYMLLVYSIFQTKNAQFHLWLVLFLLWSFHFKSQNICFWFLWNILLIELHIVNFFLLRIDSLVNLSLCFSCDSLDKRVFCFVLLYHRFIFALIVNWCFVNSTQPFWELAINVIKDILRLILLIFSSRWICQLGVLLFSTIF